MTGQDSDAPQLASVAPTTPLAKDEQGPTTRLDGAPGGASSATKSSTATADKPEPDVTPESDPVPESLAESVTVKTEPKSADGQAKATTKSAVEPAANSANSEQNNKPDNDKPDKVTRDGESNAELTDAEPANAESTTTESIKPEPDKDEPAAAPPATPAPAATPTAGSPGTQPENPTGAPKISPNGARSVAPKGFPVPGSQAGPQVGPMGGPNAGPSAGPRPWPKIGPNEAPNPALNQRPNQGPNQSSNQGPNQGATQGPNQGPNQGFNQGTGQSPNQSPNQGPGQVPGQGSNQGLNQRPSLPNLPGPPKPPAPSMPPPIPLARSVPPRPPAALSITQTFAAIPSAPPTPSKPTENGGAGQRRSDGLPPLHESWLPREHPLHRPRHGRGQRGSLVAAVVFFLVPAVAFVFGVRPQAIENHPLAAFPSPAAGWGFFTEMSTWATDNLPLRNLGVQAGTAISERVFGEPPAYSGSDQQSPAGPVGGVPTTTQTNPNVDMSQVIQGQNGWLFYTDDMTAKCDPSQSLSQTISALATLRQAIEASGRNFVLVVAPDKSTVYPQYLPADYTDKACAQAVAGPFWSQVTSVAGAVDLRAGLQAMEAHSQVYYPDDTHWTDVGALYMVRAIAQQLDPTAPSTWRTTPSRVITGPADLSALIGQQQSENDQTYHLMPDGSTVRSGSITADLSQPVTFKSTPLTGMVDQPVTVLGDSFLLPATRYLPGAFSDVTAVNYGSAASEPSVVQQAMIGAKTVVLEVVERSLTAGTAPMLEPQVIDGIRAALAAHPMR